MLLRRAWTSRRRPTPPPGDAFERGDESVSDIANGVIKPLLKGFLLDKPLIAAVEGPAVAGGTEILQGTDIRIAGESARFGVSEVRWGLYPLGGSVVRLRRQIPYTVAADILLTGRHLPRAGGEGDRADRRGRARRHRPRPGPRGGGDGRRQRAGRRAGGAAGAAGHRVPAGAEAMRHRLRRSACRCS